MAFSSTPIIAHRSAPIAGLASARSSFVGSRAGPVTRQNCQRAARTVVFEVKASAEKPAVMVNGTPGKMGVDVSKAVLRRGLQLVPCSLTGEEITISSSNVEGVDVKLLQPSIRDGLFPEIKQAYPNLIAVDYTHPTAVVSNAEFYAKYGVPFVMGTTGGDRDALMKIVNDSNIYCVIAPNMGKQIVAFQAMLEHVAKEFPGAFSGYKLRVVESHQSAKADTSGTAKAVVASFKQLGVAKFEVDDIEMVRDPAEQVSRMNVPSEYLAGHAFHTYSLVSPDGSVSFEFQHNVCGRGVYCEGTVDAVLFLASKIAEKTDQRVFNMIDVLHSGSMA